MPVRANFPTMSDQRWEQNLQKTARTIDGYTDISEIALLTRDVGDIALKETNNGQVLSTGDMEKAGEKLYREAGREATLEEGESIAVKRLNCWNELSQYFTSECGIRQKVGALLVQNPNSDVRIG